MCTCCPHRYQAESQPTKHAVAGIKRVLAHCSDQSLRYQLCVAAGFPELLGELSKGEAQAYLLDCGAIKEG